MVKTSVTLVRSLKPNKTRLHSLKAFRQTATGSHYMTPSAFLVFFVVREPFQFSKESDPGIFLPRSVIDLENLRHSLNLNPLTTCFIFESLLPLEGIFLLQIGRFDSLFLV